MNLFPNKFLRILSSIIVGIVGFRLAVALVGNLGAIFVAEDGHEFFSSQQAILFLVSVLLGLITAVVLGTTFYRYINNRKQW
ncbi:MAG: hypothetical protein WCA79_01655 [Anaerolineales bacterium]